MGLRTLIRKLYNKKREKKIKTIADILQGGIIEIRKLEFLETDREGVVCLLLPTLDSKAIYGGAATAIIFAVKLSLYLKKTFRLVTTLSSGESSSFQTFLQENNITITDDNIEIIDVSSRSIKNKLKIDLNYNDLLIVSAWGDAHVAGTLPIKNFIYLIQDYEPIFFPNSDRYLLAEQTYHLKNFIPVCNTKLMYDFMVENNYKNIIHHALFFEPAVSRLKSGMVKKNLQKKNLFLYGRIRVERNLFYTALMAISHLCERGFLKKDEWNLYMAGEDEIPLIQLPNGQVIINNGKMEMKEYISFSKTIDVAITLMMSPHPNYPTLEMHHKTCTEIGI